MSTRTGARIWRGPIRLLAPGACPHCGVKVTVTSTGRRRDHNDPSTGVRCTGAGITVGELTVDLTDLPDIQFDRRPEVAAPPSCPECGVSPPGRLRADGRLRRHRVRNEDPTAPWCTASPTDRTD